MTTMALHSSSTWPADAEQGSFSKPNVGGYDRLVRVALASVLLADGLHGTGPLGLESLFIMASVLLYMSAMMAWDPVYALFKVRTATLRAHPLPYWRMRVRNANGGINVGTVDRMARIVLASVLLATPFLWLETIGAPAVIATFAGIAVMMTAITGWDPFYHSFGVRTATLPIESAPDFGDDANVTQLTLIDPVKGDDDDVYQKAA